MDLKELCRNSQQTIVVHNKNVQILHTEQSFKPNERLAHFYRKCISLYDYRVSSRTFFDKSYVMFKAIVDLVVMIKSRSYSAIISPLLSPESGLKYQSETTAKVSSVLCSFQPFLRRSCFCRISYDLCIFSTTAGAASTHSSRTLLKR